MEKRNVLKLQHKEKKIKKQFTIIVNKNNPMNKYQLSYDKCKIYKYLQFLKNRLVNTITDVAKYIILFIQLNFIKKLME